jgi:hypothetical protein
MIPSIRTFKDWSQDGYKIRKGSKSIGRNEKGECLFSRRQVTKQEPPIYVNHGSFSHWDATTDECGGPAYGLYGNCD